MRFVAITLYHFCESNKRQETCLAEQNDAFDRQSTKKTRRIEFFSIRINPPIELPTDNNYNFMYNFIIRGDNNGHTGSYVASKTRTEYKYI